MGRSLVQRSPTECGVSAVMEKPRRDLGPIGLSSHWRQKSRTGVRWTVTEQIFVRDKECEAGTANHLGWSSTGLTFTSNEIRSVNTAGDFRPTEIVLLNDISSSV